MNETSRKPNFRSMTLGIIGIVFSIIAPGVTLSVSIPGLVSAVKRKWRNGTAGLALNIVALSLAAVNVISALTFTARMYVKRVY
ncbi:MAG: hypothetical protein LBM87_00020 [Ruminococcus sp.]|nr:hypothetical protein [Ruminococcus sp.]